MKIGVKCGKFSSFAHGNILDMPIFTFRDEVWATDNNIIIGGKLSTIG